MRLSVQIGNKNKDVSILGKEPTVIHKFKGKGSEIKDYTLCLGVISKDFTIDNMKKKKEKKKNRIKRQCIFSSCSVDFNPIHTNDILYKNNYLMKKDIT